MKSPQVEVARQTRRIKKDYTNLNLSSKYSESHISPPVKKRKVCSSRLKHKESDQNSVWQRQLKENVLKRCLDLGEPIPEQVLAFLNKQEKTITFQKMNIKFPSQDAYNASIISARRAIDFQEETVKALVGAKDNQSLFDFMAKQRRRKYSEKEEQQDLNNKQQKEQLKQLQSSQSIMIEQLKQNLQYKINPQFIKSELKKEMMQKDVIKNQVKTLNNQIENEVSKDNEEHQLQGKLVERQKIVVEADNKECLTDSRKLYPKNVSSTTRRSRLNTAPSTPNEPHLSPVRAPVRQYSVQIQNFGPYYYPQVSDGQTTQFEEIRGGVGEDILCNQEVVQESYGYNPGLNNSYHPYGTQWNKENCERARIMIEDQCRRDENDHLGGYLQIQQQQADRQEPNYDYQNSVDMSFLSSFCYSNSQHPQAQAEDMLEVIDQQPEIEQEYFCHYQQNHIEASPLRLFPRQMLDEQDHFESNNNHTDFN